MTGHGGDEFLKFQDTEEISAFDIADAFETMWQKKRRGHFPSLFYILRHANRYNEIFFMIDSCQANSMYSKFYSPNILATASSDIGENSYSVWSLNCSHLPFSSSILQHVNDAALGVSVIDKFTHHILQYMERVNKTSKATMADLV